MVARACGTVECVCYCKFAVVVLSPVTNKKKKWTGGCSFHSHLMAELEKEKENTYFFPFSFFDMKLTHTYVHYQLSYSLGTSLCIYLDKLQYCILFYFELIVFALQWVRYVIYKREITQRLWIVAGVMALCATSSYYDMTEIATRVLPNVVVLTVDADR